MHNIISQNQLAEWNNLDVKLSDYQNELDKVNDYFGCLIECEENQSECKRICKYVLKDE